MDFEPRNGFANNLRQACEKALGPASALQHAAERFSEALKAVPSFDQKTLDRMNVSIASPGLTCAAEKCNKRLEQFDNSLSAIGFPAIPSLKLTLLDVDQVRGRVDRFTEFCEEHDFKTVMRNFKQSQVMPRNKKSDAWRALDQLSPQDAIAIAPYLPSLICKRGRPKGAGTVAREHDMLMAEMKRLVESGMKPTTAARKILKSQGYTAGVKHRADYLVRKFRADQKAE